MVSEYSSTTHSCVTRVVSDFVACASAPCSCAAPRLRCFYADKEALRTAYKLRLLAIREELNYFCRTASTSRPSGDMANPRGRA